MNMLKKVLLISATVLIVILVAAISFTIGWRPFIGPRARPLTSRKFESTPQRLERGRYLFNFVSACSDCHSQHDATQAGAPVIAGTEGSGEVMEFDDLPGRVVAPNLTPDPQTGSGRWTDDQIARAIREGIGHDGRTLFPMMPYTRYREMSDEDLASLVVYIRSLPPMVHSLPKTEIIFPVKYLIRSAPQPITSTVTSPNHADQVKWGGYLVKMASCDDCHTPEVRGAAVAGMEFAGGNYLKGAWGTAAAANITPDDTGIGNYNEGIFLQAFRTGYVGTRQLSAVMPYEFYGGMSNEDLKAIFAYLRTLKPVKHVVDNSLPPTYCKLCRHTHGGGDKN